MHVSYVIGVSWSSQIWLGATMASICRFAICLHREICEFLKECSIWPSEIVWMETALILFYECCIEENSYISRTCQHIFFVFVACAFHMWRVRWLAQIWPWTYHVRNLLFCNIIFVGKSAISDGVQNLTIWDNGSGDCPKYTFSK